MVKLFQAAALASFLLVVITTIYLFVGTPQPASVPAAGATAGGTVPNPQPQLYSAPVTRAPENFREGAVEILLTTEFGPLRLKLWPKLAPKHVEQLVKVARAGIFDGSALIRIEKNFVIQFGGSFQRPSPLTPEQQAAVTPIPAEFSDVKHERRTLSMARLSDIDSADTSFSILLAAAPHLDGQYTVFGELDAADESTLQALEAQPVVTGTTKPVRQILIQKAEVP